jgi:hypothetical protein
MDNQHKKIKGYRYLSQQEIDLMNRIKAHGEETDALILEVNKLRIDGQKHDLHGVPYSRIDSLSNEQASESIRCLATAKTQLQTGQMWFVRAVALPDSF